MNLPPTYAGSFKISSIKYRNIMDNLIIENLRGFEIKFKTKPGVFSRESIDVGSKLLINNFKIVDDTLLADLGSGGGIIGIVAAKLNYHGHVHLLEDHVSAANLAGDNIELNGLKNVEVYLSDLFSAVEGRTYHQIFSNPPQHLGNDFLEKAAGDCFKHLKPGGEVSWVVQKHVKPVIERLFKKYFRNCTIVAHSKEHVVLKARRKSA